MYENALTQRFCIPCMLPIELRDDPDAECALAAAPPINLARSPHPTVGSFRRVVAFTLAFREAAEARFTYRWATCRLRIASVRIVRIVIGRCT